MSLIKNKIGTKKSKKTAKRGASVAVAAFMGVGSLFGLNACGDKQNNAVPEIDNTNQTQVEENTAAIDAIKQELEDFKNELKDSQDTIKDLQAQINSNSENIQFLLKKYISITEEMSTIQKSIEAVQTKLDAGQDLSSVTTEISKLTSDLATLTANVDEINKKMEELGVSDSGAVEEFRLVRLKQKLLIMQTKFAVYNTFSNNYVTSNYDYSPYNLRLYSAPNGEFSIEMNNNGATTVMVNNDGKVFTNNNGQERIESRTISFLDYVLGKINEYTPTNLDSDERYVDNDNGYEVSRVDDMILIGNTKLGNPGNEYLHIVLDENNYINYFSEQSPKIENGWNGGHIERISEEEYFQGRTNVEAQIQSLTCYKEVMSSVDKLCDNPYVQIDMEMTSEDAPGQTGTVYNTALLSNTSVAMTYDFRDSENQTILTQCLITKANGTCVGYYKQDNVVEEMSFENQMFPTTMNSFKLSVKQSFVDGLQSIIYDETSGSYVLTVGYDSNTRTEITVNLDENGCIDSMTQSGEVVDDSQDSYAVGGTGVFKVLTKQEYTEKLAEIKTELQALKTEFDNQSNLNV